MLATSTQQDTTPETTVIQPPDLTLGQYAAIRDGIAAAYPDQATRIERGLDTLMTTEIRATAELGVYLVATSANPRQYYRCTGRRCICPDSLNRQVVCRHSYAIVILGVASAIASYERAAGERQTPESDPNAPIPYIVLAERQSRKQAVGA